MKKSDTSTIKDLHRQALKYAEEGRLDEAEGCLELAILEEATNPVLRIHLANILKEKKQFVQAEHQLQALIKMHPDFAPAYNNLGTVLFAQEKFAEAAIACQTAIDMQPDYVDAYFNLGLALIKAKRQDEALNVFLALVELVPEHVGGRFQLGCSYMLDGKYQRAREQFLWIEASHPFHAETLSNLASCCLKLGLLDEAKSYYLRALELLPNDTQLLFNLGVIDMQQGKIRDAIQYYSRAVKINPDFYEGHNNLSVAYLAVKDYDAAKLHFQEVLRMLPSNEAVRHTMAILNKDEKVMGSPPEYIQTLFDSYADHYDSHLSQALHYQVPGLLYEVVQASGSLKNKQLDLLDLGCGTGLTGVCFKQHAKSLTGVDLSEKMLLVAAEKKIYDELIQADVISYLADKECAYDLITAGDVLNYFGDLATLFKAVARALKPEGMFVFNAEIGNQAPYRLTESGRFEHSKAYLDTLASQYQLTVRHYQASSIRTQNDVEVPGHIYLLCRAS